MKKLKHRPREIGNAVQVGLQRGAHRDLYFFFLHWSWPRVFGLFFSFYFLLNAFFAFLYTLQPDSITNARSGSFIDAFFFSVETFATIGFGNMGPATRFAHIIVTIEAATGLIAVAMATGVMFAKLARAQAKVLFSKTAVIMRRNGEKTLSIRVANARGNDLVEATVNIVVLVQDQNTEGQRMRLMKDLKLERSRSPFFRLSWQIMHKIDSESPLAELLSAEQASPHFLGFTVTVMGHDGTFGQTVYARHIYYPDDLRMGHRFVDVLSELPDGRTLMDYGKFHETYAE